VSNNSGQEETWIKSIEIEDKGVIIKYIYSFYFSCTTILTVGYGDISPKNHIEVLVVCLVEIFGIAIFGYLLSEIGYNLGIMRKDREVIEKDLAVL
jgi:predicted acyltransferase